MKRRNRFPVLLLALLLLLCGCGKSGSAQETAAMPPSESVQQLAQAIGCTEQTASSIGDILARQGIADIAKIDIQKKTDWYCILDITTADSVVYTVTIGLGYTVEKITRDGDVIYRVIQ